MLHRVLPLLAVLALFALVCVPAVAADDNVVEGKVVKIADGKLTISDKDKKEHTCTVSKECKIICDGKACKLEELKVGAAVKVTVEKKEATKIDASTK